MENLHAQGQQKCEPFESNETVSRIKNVLQSGESQATMLLTIAMLVYPAHSLIP